MSPKDLTTEMLISWGGEEVFKQALLLAKKNQVVSGEWDETTHIVSGKISLSSGWDMPTSFTLLANGRIQSHCPCRTNQEFGMVCPHVVALAFYVMCIFSDPESEAKHQREKCTAQRIANINPKDYIQRSVNGEPMRLSLTWSNDALLSEFYGKGVASELLFYNRSGVAFKPESPVLRLAKGVHLSTGSENLLSILEDICEGPATHHITLQSADFLNVIAMIALKEPLESGITATCDEVTGKIELKPYVQLPTAFNSVSNVNGALEIIFLVYGRQGFVRISLPDECDQTRYFYYPLKKVLPVPFQSIYQKSEILERENIPSFLQQTLPQLRKSLPVTLNISEDLFQFVNDKPKFQLRVEGSLASLSAQLVAVYGKQEIVCGSKSSNTQIVRPDTNDILLYYLRNREVENLSCAKLKNYGFEASPDGIHFYIANQRLVLNFMGSGAPTLERSGWKIIFSNRLNEVIDSLGHIVPLVDVRDVQKGKRSTFEVACNYDDGGRNIAPAEIQGALNRGDGFVKHNGEILLLDSDAVGQMRMLFADCPSQPGERKGTFQVSNVYAPYVYASLDVMADAIVLEDENAPQWRSVAVARNHDEKAKWERVDLGRLENTLRPYQKEGVYWMRFLEKSGLSGLLADEMGLGKTLQTLTWLSLKRLDADAEGKPALVVCPTSLVQNWAEEASKFTPWLRVCVVSGTNRTTSFKAIADADLVITSYALLQRDLEIAYGQQVFSVVVLDEAQHIKNRNTRNARTVKQLQTVQKLVLTGTPVENSVSDVWSIFDFLMPDYLGRYDDFKVTTQDTIEAGGSEGALEQARLQRKLHPFILRRLKETVAKDLPEKIIKVVYCSMTLEQQQWYQKLCTEARGKMDALVKAQGFAKSRIQLLAILMRLRQVANDVSLLKEYREKFDKNWDNQNFANSTDIEENNSNVSASKLKQFLENELKLSGKLDAFLELLDEAISGGHRILVFSQFVMMLSILRQVLKTRGIEFAYLDGSTQDRAAQCSRFNTNPKIPVFLISLHAGGTGLNLTGADMVVHFDPWWNPAVEAQATDRAHRIGQKRTVYVLKLITQNTIEERVLQLQQKKQRIIDATVDTTDETFLQKLSYEDIRNLI